MVEQYGPVQSCHRLPMPPLNSSLKSEQRKSTTLIGPNTKEANSQTSAPNMLQTLCAPSPTSSCNQFVDISGIPPAIARDPCRKRAYVKARAQYARDQALEYASGPPRMKTADETRSPIHRVGCDGFGPTRKRSAFVKEEELQCRLEDRVGTAHISELQPDFEAMPPLSVEEMSMDDQADDRRAGVERSTGPRR